VSDTNEEWTKIENAVKSQIAVIILDEIDKMLIKNRNEVHCCDPIVASEPDAGDAQDPDSQVSKADFSLE
jgi:hypothetical protein